MKILGGCVALACVTAALGAFVQSSQRDLGSIAISLYDNTFLAMSYLRSAQNRLLHAEASLQRSNIAEVIDDGRAGVIAALPEAADDLIVAVERAPSQEAQLAAENLTTSLLQLSEKITVLSSTELSASIQDLNSTLDTLVELYAAEGFRQRRSAGQLIEASLRHTWLAIGLSLLIALLITAILTRAIIPPVRAAVAIARAIAGGRFDNEITSNEGSRSETDELLRALATMQASFVELLAAQEASHSGRMEAQLARFDAALSNMVQGLCLFGPDDTLTVVNRRFVEMFGQPAMGCRKEEAFGDPQMARLFALDDHRDSICCDLADGRSFMVTRRAVTGGGWLATYEDLAERRQAEARLVHMAHHDSLTGLPNRAMFREHMTHALGRAQRQAGLAVMLLDLDRFKTVNDTLGHLTGDALLCQVAERLKACTRPADLVVRLGGDEFAIVQEAVAAPEDVSVLAERLVAALAEPFHVEGQQVNTGTSIGIALTHDGLDEANEMLKRADLALYRAKEEGRGTWRFFEPAMNARVVARRQLEQDLRRAVTEEQFQVYYQPVVEAEGGQISGFEALVRWVHPERGMVSPAEFIPLAEELGLIRAIGGWVLRQACSAAAAWPGELKVAVNLSPVQFSGGALVAEVASALKHAGLAPHCLELEITESLLLTDDAAVLATLHELRALGVRIAMDDFGTGYSSLSYLQRFPFDKIKIDQSFVRGLGQDEHCTAIIRAVVGLGKALGMTVNAEGVETAEQLETLRAEGCGEFQGYLFSKPRPSQDVRTMLGSPEYSPASVRPGSVAA
ncbi:putative bifunctional diguanylate cyclase/phosphodiesterase [Muricoccus nepalensis]|nr:EAL domain-containing protein [Roseomonas nepalensis]